MARNIITGIDIGSSTVRVVTVEQKKDGGLNVLAVSQKESEGVKRGSITNLEAAAKTISGAVKSAEKMSGAPIKRVVVSVGGISLGSCRAKGMVRTSRVDGEITEHDIKRLVAQSESNLINVSNKRIIHTIPLSFKIDNSFVHGRPTELKGTKLEVETLFITYINLHLSDLIKTVESAGLVIDDIIAAPLAMSCAVLTKQQKETGCVLTNIGASTVSVVVFEEDLPISLEVFPIGSSHITNDIALGLLVPLDEAEQIKLNYGADNVPSPKRKLLDIVEARLSDIFEMIESHLKKINRNGVLPAGIVLTGSGSNLFSLEEVAKAALRLPAKIGPILPRANHSLNISAASSSLKEQILNDPGWSVAVGLCVASIDEGCLAFESNKSSKGGAGALGAIKKWFQGLLP